METKAINKLWRNSACKLHSFSHSGIIYLVRKVVFSSFYFSHWDLTNLSTSRCTLDTRKALNEYPGDFAILSGFIQVYGFKPFKNVLHPKYFTPFHYPPTRIWKGTLSLPLQLFFKYPFVTFISLIMIFTLFHIPFENFHFKVELNDHKIQI